MDSIINSTPTLNKSNVEEPAFHSDSYSTSNSITDNQHQIITDDNRSTLSNDDVFNMELDKLNTDLRVKPQHWTDEYWEEVLDKYRWFLHKDEHAGCKICLNSKGFMGKKSQLAIMKLYLMNLSYEEFELKLTSHEETEQHKKSINILKGRFNCNNNKSDDVLDIKVVPEKKVQTKSKSYMCPQCGKFYAFKKSLVNHVHNCNDEKNLMNFDLPCRCQIKSIFSLYAIDEHINKSHLNYNIFYICPICDCEIEKTTLMFEHLFLQHNYYWDPYTEFPDVIDKSDLNFGQRRKMERKSTVDNVENINPIKNESNEPHLMPPKRKYVKRILNEVPETVKPQFSSKLFKYEQDDKFPKSIPVSLNDIVTCPICESRYVNREILNNHYSKYHSFTTKEL